MDNKNPLRFNASKSRRSDLNKSGRPTNTNAIKFSPQPKSLVSQMLKKLKEQCSESNLCINARNINQEKCSKLNSDASISSVNNPLDPVMDVARISNNCKGNKTYPCDFPNCNYECKFSSNLIKHKRTHTSEKRYLCHLCSFRSNFINSLKVHQRIHTAEKPYKCNYCSYRCNSSSNLKKHCKHRHCTVTVEKQETEHINIDPKT